VPSNAYAPAQLPPGLQGSRPTGNPAPPARRGQSHPCQRPYVAVGTRYQTGIDRQDGRGSVYFRPPGPLVTMRRFARSPRCTISAGLNVAVNSVSAMSRKITPGDGHAAALTLRRRLRSRLRRHATLAVLLAGAMLLAACSSSGSASGASSAQGRASTPGFSGTALANANDVGITAAQIRIADPHRGDRRHRHVQERTGSGSRPAEPGRDRVPAAPV